MPYNKLLLGLQVGNAAANATYTYSTTNTSFAIAQQTVQQITLNNGVWADNGLWYPLSAIISVTPQ